MAKLENEALEIKPKTQRRVIIGKINGLVVHYVQGVEYATAVRLEIEKEGEKIYTNTAPLPERIERRYLDIGDRVILEAETENYSPEIIEKVYSLRNPEKNVLRLSEILRKRLSKS
jgi:hypothetical protein